MWNENRFQWQRNEFQDDDDDDDSRWWRKWRLCVMQYWLVSKCRHSLAIAWWTNVPNRFYSHFNDILMRCQQMTFHRTIFRIPATRSNTYSFANVCSTHSMTNNILHFNYSSWISIADVFRILILSSSPSLSIGRCFTSFCLNTSGFFRQTNEFNLFIIIIVIIICNKPYRTILLLLQSKMSFISLFWFYNICHVRVEKYNFISFDRQYRLLTSAQVLRPHFSFASAKTNGEQEKKPLSEQKNHPEHIYNIINTI